ncbi:MAG: ABC transporter permease [Sphaerochaetaceae bacterium]|jgi:ribose transport system permease protein
MALNTKALVDRLKRTGGSLLILIVIVVVMTLIDKRFLSPENVRNILRIGAITVIAVYGQTFVMLTGQIDLSMGAVASLSSVIIGLVVVQLGWPLFISIIFALLVGALVGLVNGVLVFHFGLPSFITTFGMFTSLSGFASSLTGSTPIELAGLCNIGWIGRGFVGAVPIPIIIAAIAFIILHLVLNNTGYGRTVKAIGYNRKVALLSGRKVKLIGIITYVLSGFLVGLTAVLMSSRIYCAHPDLAPNLAFDAIAAAAVGGISMQGGKGNLVEATIGALIIVALLNGLTLVNVTTYMQMVTRGLVIIVAVALNNVRTFGFANVTGISFRRKKVGVEV